MAVSNVGNQKTIQQIIDQSKTSTSDRNTSELGKDDFLKLLVTQLRYQDPLKPVDDKEFIGQMAQFSALEQMQNMNSSLSQSQAFSLIGKKISANITDDATKQQTIVEGDVTSVKVNAGKTYVVVNGEDIPVDKITDITDGSKISKAGELAQFTNLIGYNAKGVVYDPKTSDIIAVSGMVTAIQKGLYEDYAVMDGVTADISEVLGADGKANGDPNYIKQYLEDHKPPKDNIVTLMLTDSQTGAKVPVTAKLLGYTVEGNKITVTLNGVNVPVESISNVTPGEQQKTNEEDLLKQILDKLSGMTNTTTQA